MKPFFFILAFACSMLSAKVVEKKIVVVIPSYNNEQWLELNITSILDQKYHNYRVIYLNDNSSDNTAKNVEALVRSLSSRSLRIISFDDNGSKNIPEKIEKFTQTLNERQAFFTLVNNKNRCGALENLYRAIHSCKGDEIIVTVDGDDWLYHNKVLTKLNQIYSSREIWMTHGKLIEYPNGSSAWCEAVPAELIARNAVRQFKCPSHLRTFYAWLFNKIALEDLIIEGEFYPMTWDMAIMYPMLEMAAERHFFFQEPNYVYNVSNPINDNKVNAELQRQLDRRIRNMQPYQRLETKSGT